MNDTGPLSRGLSNPVSKAAILSMPLAALCAALALSGCASAFVGGGVATVSGQDGRVDIDARTAGASVGPAGPSAGAARASASVCTDAATGATYRC